MIPNIPTKAEASCIVCLTPYVVATGVNSRVTDWQGIGVRRIVKFFLSVTTLSLPLYFIKSQNGVRWKGP